MVYMKIISIFITFNICNILIPLFKGTFLNWAVMCISMYMGKNFKIEREINKKNK